MPYELIYTSAPRGLLPGAKGFSTVKATKGIPVPLREYLESISQYRAVFPPHHPQASQNPQALSHLRVRVSGSVWNVLSRNCDAGLDHTRRSNTFSHHIAFKPNELPESSPAWLLAHSSYLEDVWDQRVEHLETIRNIPRGDDTVRVCHAWKGATGDAGWGGVAVEHLLQKKTVYLVFKSGMQTLALIREALALMPKPLQWQTTFSTYFTGLAAGSDCQLRCVLEGSAEHQRAASSHDAVLILTDRSTACSDTDYARAARSGSTSGMSSSGPSKVESRDSSKGHEVVSPSQSAGVTGRQTSRRPVQRGSNPPPLRTQGETPPPLPSSSFVTEASNSRHAPLLAWPVALLLGVLAGAITTVGIGLPFVLNDGQSVTAQADTKDSTSVNSNSVENVDETNRTNDQRQNSGDANQSNAIGSQNVVDTDTHPNADRPMTMNLLTTATVLPLARTQQHPLFSVLYGFIQTGPHLSNSQPVEFAHRLVTKVAVQLEQSWTLLESYTEPRNYPRVDEFRPFQARARRNRNTVYTSKVPIQSIDVIGLPSSLRLNRDKERVIRIDDVAGEVARISVLKGRDVVLRVVGGNSDNETIAAEQLNWISGLILKLEFDNNQRRFVALRPEPIQISGPVVLTMKKSDSKIPIPWKIGAKPSAATEMFFHEFEFKIRCPSRLRGQRMSSIVNPARSLQIRISKDRDQIIAKLASESLPLLRGVRQPDLQIEITHFRISALVEGVVVDFVVLSDDTESTTSK